MGIDVGLKGARKGRRLEISRYGEAHVVLSHSPIMPAVGHRNQVQYLVGVLGSTGLGTGITNQAVDGSVTPQKFKIESEPDYDIYIQQITVVIADGAIAHNTFGDLAQLSVGWDLIFHEDGIVTPLVSKAKTNGQVIIQSGLGAAFGTSADSFELVNYTGSTDACIATFPVHRFVPGGLRIGRQSVDKIESVVNDNLTGLTEFLVYVYGHKHFG